MKTFLSLSLLLIVSLAASAAETAKWVNVLGSPDARVEEKARACQRLGEFGGEEAVTALAALLPDPVLNPYARAGLERIPGPRARAALREALGRCEGVALIGTIESLGALGVVEAAGELTKLIESSDAGVSGAALRSLGRMGAGTLPVVLEHLAAFSTEVRASAATAGLLAAEHSDLRDDPGARWKIYDAILRAGVPRGSHLAAIRGAILTGQSLPFLLKQLRSPDRDVQDVAFLALRSFPQRGLAEALHAELATAEGERQIRVVRALRDCSNSETVGVLVDQLGGAKGELRTALIQTLGSLGGDAAARALIERVNDEESAQALAAMEGEGIDAQLLDALNKAADPVRRVRLISILGNRQSRAAIDPLLDHVKNRDPKVSRAALRALRPLVGLAQVPKLIAWCKTSEGENRELALLVLVTACRQSDPPEAADRLIVSELESAADPEARNTWKRVLAAIEGFRAARNPKD